MTIWLGLMYAVVPAALILWARQRRKKFQLQAVHEPEVVTDAKKKKRLVLWVVIAMIGTACLLVFGLFDSNWKVQHMTAAAVQKMVMDGNGKEGDFSVLQYQNGYSYLWIVLQENGKKTKIIAPLDDTTLAMIKAHGIKCPTYVQGRDFEVFGWPGRLLPIFCVFILAIGGVVLLRRPGKFNPQEMDAKKTQKMQQVDRLANKVFGTVVALVLIAMSLLIFSFTISHYSQSISGAAAGKIITENKNARFEVFQLDNGSKELWITPSRSRHYPGFIAPADDATLALLADNKISYKTFVQGRDFGHRDPSRWILVPSIFILPAGAVWLVRRAWKKPSETPATANN
jgi:hypothetical protein